MIIDHLRDVLLLEAAREVIGPPYRPWTRGEPHVARVVAAHGKRGLDDELAAVLSSGRGSWCVEARVGKGGRRREQERAATDQDGPTTAPQKKKKYVGRRSVRVKWKSGSKSPGRKQRGQRCDVTPCSGRWSVSLGVVGRSVGFNARPPSFVTREQALKQQSLIGNRRSPAATACASYCTASSCIPFADVGSPGLPVSWNFRFPRCRQGSRLLLAVGAVGRPIALVDTRKAL